MRFKGLDQLPNLTNAVMAVPVRQVTAGTGAGVGTGLRVPVPVVGLATAGRLGAAWVDGEGVGDGVVRRDDVLIVPHAATKSTASTANALFISVSNLTAGRQKRHPYNQRTPNLSQELTAVILAAGHGTRMRSRTPKVLHPICGRPMVDWVVDAVRSAGATDVKAIVSSHHAEVAAHLDGTTEVIYQREPEGTGHAVQQVPAEVLARGDVLVVNADSPLLTAETMRKLVEAHRSSGAQATIASVEDPRRDDGRILRKRDGSFDRIVEKKDATAEDLKSQEFNVGLYCFQGGPLVVALDLIKKDNQAAELYLPDVLGHLAPVNVVRINDPDEAMGINDRSHLARAIAAMRGRILDGLMAGGVTITDPPSTFIDGTVRIGQDTVIEPFTHIKGQTVIGESCRIGPHVHIEDARIGDRSDCGPFVKIRPGTVVDQDVHIGSFAELVRTTVGRGSKVPHVSYLGDTAVGEDANVGAGTITANFNGEVKNKTQIGDGAFVGVDTMLVAPVKLGKGSRTGAGSVVTKDVPDGATAVGVPARVIRRKTVGADHK